MLSLLSYPIRLHVVAKYLGLIFIISSGLALVPLVASLLWHEYQVTLRYGVVGALFLIVGLSTLAIPSPKKLQANEAFAVVALSFLLGSVAMIYPMMGSGLNAVDAWFEAVSGLTTTGLSVVDIDVIDINTFFFARAWMQWYGGLGIIVFSLSLAFLPGTVSKTFIKQVAYKDDRIENSKIFARKILVIYSIITILGVIALKLLGLNFIEAMECTFSAISTGGFSPYSDSLRSFSRVVQGTILSIAFLGALSFPNYWLTSLSSLKSFIKDRQLHGLLILVAVFTLLMMWLNRTSWIESLLTVTSTQTTTGFSTFDMTGLDSSTRFLFLFSMLIGGGTLSSAGGIKILRLLIIFQAIRLLFLRTSLTKDAVVSEARYPEFINCLTLFALYLAVIFVSTLIFVGMGFPPLDALFDVMSATGTVGISSGVTVADMPSLLKVVLSIDMLLGRLEVVTLLVLFYPRTLFGRRVKA